MRGKKSNSKNVARRVRIVGEGVDECGNRYIKFRVDGIDKDISPFSVKQLVKDPSPLFAELANAGWNGFTSKAHRDVLAKLESRKPKRPKFKVATRLGWNSGAFVLPDKIIGRPGMPLETVFSGLDPIMLAKYCSRGTLEQWQDKIAAHCSGNSRLICGICFALTGPILPLVQGPKAGGFQVWGAPETGKTTMAMVSGSVWGCHRSEGRREKGFAESWNSTANKLEVTALAHNDALLILDETKAAGSTSRLRAEVVSSVALSLAEMTEKDRLTNPGSARSRRGYFMSTSNVSLAELGAQGHVDIDSALEGRMTDIPLPKNAHGIYEQLHGFANGETLSDALQRRARRYYGTASRAFIRRLVRDQVTNVRSLKKFLGGERKAYLAALRRKAERNGLTPLNRTSGRNATAFAAGSLARKYRIVPWDRSEILKAIVSCEIDQLRLPKQPAAAQSIEGLRVKLADHLTTNRGQFMNLNKKRPRHGRDKIDAVPGYRTKVDGQRWFYLTANQLEAIIGVGHDAREIKQALVAEGLLAQKKRGKFVVQRRVFKGGKGNQNFAWVHAIKEDILAND